MVTVDELPDDVLAFVLRRLAPRVLAACRRVCRAWRDAIDGRRLLRADLLPRSVRGIFLDFHFDVDSPAFFSRPSTGPTISAGLDFMPRVRRVLSHCNGLLLCESSDHVRYVANPATRRFARLPPSPPPPPLSLRDFGEEEEEALDQQAACLVYDPAASPHYEVFLIPHLVEDTILGPERMPSSEWPPLSYRMQVFSSAAERWQETSFLRVGEAAGCIADMRGRPRQAPNHTAYWRGALYMDYPGDTFISRISLSHGKYQIVKTPGDSSTTYLSLGISEKGVYCATSDYVFRYSIWHLNESDAQMEWVLKHHVDVSAFAQKLNAYQYYHRRTRGPWILQDINSIEEAKFEWDSDNDDVFDTDAMVEGSYQEHIGFLGFHPYKEIIFLDVHSTRGLAYHWNTSTFQNLGNIWPHDYDEMDDRVEELKMSFIYTPCWLEEFPEYNFEAQNEDLG